MQLDLRGIVVNRVEFVAAGKIFACDTTLEICKDSICCDGYGALRAPDHRPMCFRKEFSKQPFRHLRYRNTSSFEQLMSGTLVVFALSHLLRGIT